MQPHPTIRLPLSDSTAVVAIQAQLPYGASPPDLQLERAQLSQLTAQIKSMRESIKSIMESPQEELLGEKFQIIGDFSKLVEQVLSRPDVVKEILEQGLLQKFSFIHRSLDSDPEFAKVYGTKLGQDLMAAVRGAGEIIRIISETAASQKPSAKTLSLVITGSAEDCLAVGAQLRERAITLIKEAQESEAERHGWTPVKEGDSVVLYRAPLGTGASPVSPPADIEDPGTAKQILLNLIQTITLE